jgi:hypothetical protein
MLELNVDRLTHLLTQAVLTALTNQRPLSRLIGILTPYRRLPEG